MDADGYGMFVCRMQGITVHERTVKTALRRADLTGSFVLGKYALAPSMACAHGCAYCDGRAEKYWVEGVFDRDVVVRTNLAEVLAAEIGKLRERGFVSIGSGITDAYQPVPEVLAVMRECAAVLARHDFPVVLLTKSALALRDLDLWSEVNRRSRFLLVVSLTHSDDRTRAAYEPGASSVDERLDMLRAFRAAGCATGILAMPFLPAITDTEENLTCLYDLLAAIGVDFIQPGDLTLRPGRQKSFFLDRIAGTRPDLLELYHRLYAEDRRSGAAVRSYREEVYPRALAHNRRVRVSTLPPHRIYHGVLHRYDETNVLIEHMRELYGAAGVDTRRLDQASQRYRTWLVARKAVYNRHTRWRYEDLDAELTSACDGTASPTVEEIVGNERLAALIRSIVIDRSVFDYVDRRLV